MYNEPWGWHEMPEELGFRRKLLEDTIHRAIEAHSTVDTASYEQRRTLATVVANALDAGTSPHGGHEFFSRGTHYVTDSDGVVIAYTWSEDRARLIAAAPELLREFIVRYGSLQPAAALAFLNGLGLPRTRLEAGLA